MRLSDREPQKLTKTVLSGGMVSCGGVSCCVVSCGMVSCGVVGCGVVGCSHFFPIPSLSPIFFGQKLSLNIFSIIWYIICQIKWSFLSKLARHNTGVPPKDKSQLSESEN